jgi:hypothetical protein
VTVTFQPEQSGLLVLTRESAAAKDAEAQAGHETYFLDWPLYRRFADFPFARIFKLKPPIGASRQRYSCPPIS